MNRPVISQTSSMEDVSQSVDAHAPLLRVYTFGAFHLDWQVPPFTTEDMWKSRTSARTLFKLMTVVDQAERLQFFCEIAWNVGRHLFWRKPMHQDRFWLLWPREEPEVLRLVKLVAPFGETGFERGAVDSVAVHHDHIPDEDAPLVDRDHSSLLRRRCCTGLMIDDTAFLPKRALRLAG